MSIQNDHNNQHVPMTMREPFFSDPFFRNSWHDFDRIHDEMSNESRNFWGQIENQHHGSTGDHQHQHHNGSSIENQEENHHHHKHHHNGGVATKNDNDFGPSFAPWFFPRRWLLPRLHGGEVDLMDRRLKDLNLFQDPEGDQAIIRQSDDKEKFEVSLDTHGFAPDELKVRVDGNRLSVEGRHEVKEKDRFVSRQFSRSYTLPVACLLDKVTSNLSSDGVLMITAPKQQLMLEEEGAKSVPINKQRQ